MKDGRYQVLHVEDDRNRFQNYARMVKGALDDKKIPHEIIWANSLEKACTKVMEMGDSLDMILLDISLNDREGDSGLSLVRTLRNNRYSKTPIFVVSANVERYQETLEQFKNEQAISGYSEPLGDTWPDHLPDIILGKPVSVLHLSDIHNGKFFAYKNLVINQQIVLDNLCRKLNHVDFVVVSGDISSVNSEEDYQSAVDLLSSLREKLSLSPKDFVFVPGNHDHDLSCCNSHTFFQYLNFLEKFYNGQSQPDSHYPNHELEDYDVSRQTFNECSCVVEKQMCRIL